MFRHMTYVSTYCTHPDNLTKVQQTESVCARLKRARFNTIQYHAGMSNEARIAVQDQFMESDDSVVSIAGIFAP